MNVVILGRNVILNPSEVKKNIYIKIINGKITSISNSGKPDIKADLVMPGCIDPHVHCRNQEQAYKETIRTASEAAAKGGVTEIFDMPNIAKPIIWKEDVDKRLKLAKKSVVNYKLWIGLTADKEQIQQAAEIVKTNPSVVGLKLYAGHSVGNLSVTSEEEQKKIYKILTELDYNGLLAVHCEKESETKPELWNPEIPETWCETRPEKAEIESIKDQIRFATAAGFKGTLHICHITSPESIKLIQKANGLNITCGITPHHLLLAKEDMVGRKGLYYKVNPPLREKVKVKIMLKNLKTGKINWIETDHAPHLIKEKLDLPYLSGVPELDTYSGFLSQLSSLGFSWLQIVSLSAGNPAKVFGLTREIKTGVQANLTCIDLDLEQVKKEKLETKCNWSPYEGITFPGKTKATIANGKIVYLEEE